MMSQLRQQLPYMNFYRFCQLLEQIDPVAPVPGSGWQVRQEPIRFRPHPGMGFPSSEIRGMEDPEPEHSHLPLTVRVNFMGLYGVESPLPTHYIDDIAQRREGYEAARDFLDIFNHRLITQYYRIWRKYSYPATYEAGGADNTSQYLLGLEEQLRQLSAVNDEQPRPVAQQNLAELHLQQLIARYALLKQKALDWI